MATEQERRVVDAAMEYYYARMYETDDGGPRRLKRADDGLSLACEALDEAQSAPEQRELSVSMSGHNSKTASKCESRWCKKCAQAIYCEYCEEHPEIE